MFREPRILCTVCQKFLVDLRVSWRLVLGDDIDRSIKTVPVDAVELHVGVNGLDVEVDGPVRSGYSNLTLHFYNSKPCTQ